MSGCGGLHPASMKASFIGGGGWPGVAKESRSKAATPAARQPAKVAVPASAPAEPPGPRAPREPVWLVRIVLVLFLVGFASFLAREIYNFLRVL